MYKKHKRTKTDKYTGVTKMYKCVLFELMNASVVANEKQQGLSYSEYECNFGKQVGTMYYN